MFIVQTTSGGPRDCRQGWRRSEVQLQAGSRYIAPTKRLHFLHVSQFRLHFCTWAFLVCERPCLLSVNVYSREDIHLSLGSATEWHLCRTTVLLRSCSTNVVRCEERLLSLSNGKLSVTLTGGATVLKVGRQRRNFLTSPTFWPVGGQNIA